MEYFPAPLEALVEQFAKLPGIGGKSAQRLAFHVLSLPMEEAQAFADAILEAKKTVTCCPVCRNLTAGGLCPICASPKRDGSTICAVSYTHLDVYKRQPSALSPWPPSPPCAPDSFSPGRCCREKWLTKRKIDDNMVSLIWKTAWIRTSTPRGPHREPPVLVEGRRTRRGGKIPLEQRPQQGRRAFPRRPQ